MLARFFSGLETKQISFCEDETTGPPTTLTLYKSSIVNGFFWEKEMLLQTFREQFLSGF